MIRFILTIAVLSPLATSATWVGKLSQYIYHPSSTSTLSSVNPFLLYYFSSDCQECLCYAKSLSGTPIVLLSCLNDSHTCSLFTNYSETYSFQPSSTGQVYFFQLPTSQPTTPAASTITSRMTTDATSAATRMTTTVTSARSPSSGRTVLLNITNPTSSLFPNYTCYSYQWVAPASSATLSFSFRHDPGAWLLDDVSVDSGSTSLITNGGFETGRLTNWAYTGACVSFPSQVMRSNSARTGSYCFFGQCVNSSDVISQRISTVSGSTYRINFCLTNNDCCRPVQMFSANID